MMRGSQCVQQLVGQTLFLPNHLKDGSQVKFTEVVQLKQTEGTLLAAEGG